MESNYITKIGYKFTSDYDDELWTIRKDGTISKYVYNAYGSDEKEDILDPEETSRLFFTIVQCIENADNVSENLHGDVEIFYKDGSVQKILSTISDGNTSIRELIEGCVLTA
ncbi:hypothetical protein SAMN05216390_1394 [Lachnospiraceae bacterium KH1T2]|nr:hypothetical protein SAMN05216390_1394 [Lachnospiraceae bacterium KH1T2]